MEAEIFERMAKNAKEECLKPLIGQVINGVILSITHNMEDSGVKIRSNFLVDVIPYQQ